MTKPLPEKRDTSLDEAVERELAIIKERECLARRMAQFEEAATVIQASDHPAFVPLPAAVFEALRPGGAERPRALPWWFAQPKEVASSACPEPGNEASSQRKRLSPAAKRRRLEEFADQLFASCDRPVRQDAFVRAAKKQIADATTVRTAREVWRQRAPKSWRRERGRPKLGE